jgi:hypothetical protein
VSGAATGPRVPASTMQATERGESWCFEWVAIKRLPDFDFSWFVSDFLPVTLV